MKILSISTRDIGGGAERFANDLNQSFRDAGHNVEEFVGFKRSADSSHRLIPRHQDRFSIESTYDKLEGLIPPSILNLTGFRRGFYYLRTASRGLNAINHEMGRQGYHYPASWRLIDYSTSRPDLILAHNLHGDYFDLRALTYYSQKIPTFWVLHDEWAYTGRCAYSQSCQGWRHGCGVCPDLTSYPAFPRDGSAYNLNYKKKIYQKSKLFLASPSSWIADRIEHSILSTVTKGIRVIPYGIDQVVFRPGCQVSTRRRLMIDPEYFVVTFIAVNARNNSWKDYPTFESAVTLLAEKYPQRKILCFVLGDRHESINHHRTRIEFVDGVTDKSIVRDYLVASDVYLHSARVDNYPLAILEALSCGTPVIGSGVGGIPEQVLGYEKYQKQLSFFNQSPIESATGLLVDPNSAERQFKALEVLMLDPELRSTLSTNSVVDAQKRFNLARQSQIYIEWFTQVMNGEGSLK
jgi:glycosyltransferase involved in cell wall biosynthesis